MCFFKKNSVIFDLMDKIFEKIKIFSQSKSSEEVSSCKLKFLFANKRESKAITLSWGYLSYLQMILVFVKPFSLSETHKEN